MSKDYLNLHVGPLISVLSVESQAKSTPSFRVSLAADINVQNTLSIQAS